MMKFDGFSPDLPTFLGELKANNNKAWFDENRTRYERVYLEPAKAFVAAIGPELQKDSADISVEPRVNGAIMRINRDIRFSKDKTPYKATFDLHFLEGQIKLKSNPAYLLRLTENELHLGVGAYGFNKAQLQAWRDALADNAKSKALHKALDQAAKAGFGPLHGQHYKTVPKGYPADHPNSELLKFNKAYLTSVEVPPTALFGPGAVDHCLKAYRALRPMQQWLVDELADKV